MGETIDIHGGGRDLKFPHHENEIAQSEARNGKKLANYWVHCGLVKVNGVKMSKSLKNGLSIRDALKKYTPEAIKLVILQSSYRSDLNIMPNDFESAGKHMYEFYKLLEQLKNLNLENSESELAKEIKQSFSSAMDDDFNTAKAIANMYDFATIIRKNIQSNNLNALEGVYSAILDSYGRVLSLFNNEPSEYVNRVKKDYFERNNINPSLVDDLMKQRAEYKANKDYQKADECKAKLIEMGLIVVDTKSGSFCDINFDK